MLLHNTLQELQRKQGDLAKQASEHYFRPKLPKHTPGNTHQQYCTRKEDWRKADTFTNVGSSIQAIRNLRDGRGNQQSLNIMGRNTSLQVLSKTGDFGPSCSLSVYVLL